MDQISEYQINENVNQKKNKMFSLTQMCKIWEKQSFMNIRRVSLSSPKLKKKMQFQQHVQNFYRAKTQLKSKSINMRS